MLKHVFVAVVVTSDSTVLLLGLAKVIVCLTTSRK